MAIGCKKTLACVFVCVCMKMGRLVLLWAACRLQIRPTSFAELVGLSLRTSLPIQVTTGQQSWSAQNKLNIANALRDARLIQALISAPPIKWQLWCQVGRPNGQLMSHHMVARHFEYMSDLRIKRPARLHVEMCAAWDNEMKDENGWLFMFKAWSAIHDLVLKLCHVVGVFMHFHYRLLDALAGLSYDKIL